MDSWQIVAEKRFALIVRIGLRVEIDLSPGT
jgi:hypothetical protein